METELSRIFILLSDSIAADDWEGVMTTNSCKPNLSREKKVLVKIEMSLLHMF